MTQSKPEYLRPALIAGAIAGILSGLPFIGAGNCICCLWIVGGAAMAAKLLAAQTPALLTSGDGAIVGALTGIIAAVADTVVKIPFQQYNIDLARRILDRLPDVGGELPGGLDNWLNAGSGALSPGWLLLGLFISAAVYAVIGVLGGIIGVSLFGKRRLPPVSPSTQAPIPPPPPPGPTDAV